MQEGSHIITVRNSTTRDMDAIRKLFAACFGKELSCGEWTWKYKKSPWGSAAVIALDNDSVVAHYGGIKVKFYSDAGTFDVFQPCDVMTDPKYRARLFSKRGAMIKAGESFYESNAMDFAFGFPNERHAILGTKQLGYTEHGYVTVLNKKISPFLSLRNPLLRFEAGWDSITEKEVDLLWEEVKDDLGLSIEKNSRYIFWRYRDNPVKKYEPIMVRSRYDKELKALAICSFNKPRLSVLDFFLPKGIKFGTLSNYLENIALKNALKHIQIWVHPAENIIHALLKDGYVMEKGVPLIFKILNKGLTPSFLFSHYFHRMGDYDAS